jgi:type VI secretion system secreted protein VgrG
MLVKQAERRIAVSSPLGEDVLLFRSMRASESLGRLSSFELDLLSEDHEIELEDILGQNLTVRLDMPQNGERRYFNGFASQFCYAGTFGSFACYRATLRPWLWFLTRTADSRIFQEMTVPDIIKQVFDDQGFTDLDDKLSGSYRTWTYCVQYRETDFNFVSRLMEQEGIYYYFLHEDGKHTMVLADGASSHDRASGYEQVPYYPPEEGGQRERDHVSGWSLRKDVQPGAYTLRDFDFEKPRADLEVRLNTPFEHSLADYEVYDYPGEYTARGDGDTYAKLRLEELQCQFERVEGEGDVAGLASGGLFELTNYPREDQNREYLIVSCAVELQSDAYESEAAATGETLCHCQFAAIDGKQQFRAPRVTPKPVVQGPQTAIVVGKAGEEIWTDKHGRVKVQFHWDREGKSDENSSCWIRVSSPWAGRNWGGIQIPRIGQEVIVDFLEGDPDQPIITGRVYNADNMPPYGLPANMTQSGIKSRSSKSGTPDNFNEIRFEDKKGEEQVYIHAEKNQDNVVENDETTSVGHDRTETVGNDEKITIGNHQTYSIGNNQTRSVGVNKATQVGSNHSETIGSNMTINVGSNLTETVAINYAETVGAAMELTVGAAMAQTVGATLTQTVGASKTETIGTSKSVSIGSDKSEDVGGGKTVSVGKDLGETVSGAHSEAVTKAYSLKAKTVSINAEDEISIVTGKAKINMKKNGDITIQGKKITVKGSGDVIIKGKKILEN